MKDRHILLKTACPRKFRSGEDLLAFVFSVPELWLICESVILKETSLPTQNMEIITLKWIWSHSSTTTPAPPWEMEFLKNGLILGSLQCSGHSSRIIVGLFFHVQKNLVFDLWAQKCWKRPESFEAENRLENGPRSGKDLKT